MTVAKLFLKLDDLKDFIFRITDNGGESADRYTVVTCDGDYYAMSSSPFHPQGVGMTGEGYDPCGGQERVEAGIERDIRWIDLPEDCRRCVFDGLNQGFSDWLGGFTPPATRDGAQDVGSAARLAERVGEGVYGTPGAYMIRIETCGDVAGEDDRGPFDTVREAVLNTLPEEHDLSGPEYHPEIDMWSVEGGPVEPWDRDLDPPLLDEDNDAVRFVVTGPDGSKTFVATNDDAKAFITMEERQHYESDEIGDFNRDAYAINDIGDPQATQRED